MEKGAIFLLAIMVLCVVLALLIIFGSVAAYFSIVFSQNLTRGKTERAFPKR